MWLIPIPLILPLAAAAGLALIGEWVPRRLVDSFCLLVSAACVGISLHLIGAAQKGALVYWFGGWRPEGKVAIGISFVIDPMGAGLSAFVSFLALVAFLFSWAYFKEVKALFHALMLIFLGAMNGFSLTGDLFNLFVWFELMSAAAVALCGYKSEEVGPLQGAINFAVTNTVGAFFSLIGISLLYARSGALNLAQIAGSLAQQPASQGFILAAFLFVTAGFLIKAAIVPFHFWLADAHAVAPTPVCILFSGVMVELGLYAVFRIYWTVFAPAFAGSTEALKLTLATAGTVTALGGALLCLGQRHWKRLLAFSTISHVGLMLLGLSLLRADALSGVSLYLLGHGLVKGALFIGAGILLYRFACVDEIELRGKAKPYRLTGMLLLVAALGLGGLPPFGTFFGEAYITGAAEKIGWHWVSGVFILSASLTAGAVLRALGRDFAGWGEAASSPQRGAKKESRTERETAGGAQRIPVPMVSAALLLLVAGAAVGFSNEFRGGVEIAAGHFSSPLEYRKSVFGETQSPSHERMVGISYGSALLHASLSFGLALAVAFASLFPEKIRIKRFGHLVEYLLAPLHRLHTGKVGDYVAWIAFGIALYGMLVWV